MSQYINIDRYADHMTVAEVKVLLDQEKIKEEEKEKKKIQYLKSWEGKCIFCNHNGSTGFVCLLQPNWWLKNDNDLYRIDKNTIYHDKYSINTLWFKGSSENSVDLVKEITKEQYDEVVSSLLAIERVVQTVHKKLFK